MVYDSASPYYNGFYGAYLVCRGEDETVPYGFLPDGSLDPEAAAQVPRFDFQKLVLQDFGIKTDTLVFDWKIEKIRTKVAYLGIDGWTQTDARLTVNGMQHQKEDFRRSYLQYGPVYIATSKATTIYWLARPTTQRLGRPMRFIENYTKTAGSGFDLWTCFWKKSIMKNILM